MEPGPNAKWYGLRRRHDLHWMMVYLYFALECDIPILEAMQFTGCHDLVFTGNEGLEAIAYFSNAFRTHFLKETKFQTDCYPYRLVSGKSESWSWSLPDLQITPISITLLMDDFDLAFAKRGPYTLHCQLWLDVNCDIEIRIWSNSYSVQKYFEFIRDSVDERMQEIVHYFCEQADRNVFGSNFLLLPQ